MRVLDVANPKIFAFAREGPSGTVLCVNNFSRFVQPALIPTGPWKGRHPVDLIGGAVFPSITRDDYLFSLGPHSFYWFRLATL